MNSLDFKYLLILIFFILNGCSSSTQLSSYKEAEGGESWIVKVTEKTSVKKYMPEFICRINDSVIMRASFPPMGGKSFVKYGSYRGKSVIMNGYRITNSVTSPSGFVSYNDIYEIRILIDLVLVDKFNF